jgi:histone acetyltransferase (RNA polymerase elongator complex component)
MDGRNHFFMKKNITVPIFIPHAGCPNQCIFCNQHIVTGENHQRYDFSHVNERYNLPNEADIAESVKQYLSTAGTETHKELAFFGGSFTGLPVEMQEKYLSQAASLKSDGTVDGIRLSTRPDYIDDTVLRRLLAYSVDTVEIGVQSFDDRVLCAARRGHTASDTQRALSRINASGLSLVIQLLPGLPEETRESALKSAEKAVFFKPEAVRIYPAVVLKNTPMDMLFKEGKYFPLTIEEAVDLCSELTAIFIMADIPVIKTGIHPIADLGTDAVTAGPYHPAFGFMVKARIRRNELEKMIDAALLTHPSGKLVIALPGVQTEEYIGLRRENIRWLQNRYTTALTFNIERSLTCPKIYCTD